MTVDIAISNRRWINDPATPRGRKEITTFAIRSEAFLNKILIEYPRIGTGSIAQDVSTGAVFTLMGDTSDDWIRLGS